MVHGKNYRRNFIALAQYGSLSLFRRESLGMLLMGLNQDHKDIIRTWLISRSAWPAAFPYQHKERSEGRMRLFRHALINEREDGTAYRFGPAPPRKLFYQN